MTTFPGFRALSANFTATPNQFFDRVVGHYHPCVVTVVAVLIRSTLGWADPDTGERRQEAELALSAFVRPELSESSARKGLAQAIEAGFIVCTMEPTNKQPARYALRWEDPAQQRRAIAQQRRAHGPVRRRGVPVQAPKWRKAPPRGVTVAPLTDTPQTPTPLTDAPPNSKGILNKSSPKKKQGFKEGLASPGREDGPDALGRLSPAEWAALEAEARARVIAENGNPIRELAQKGKAMERVKAMMRKILAEKGVTR